MDIVNKICLFFYVVALCVNLILNGLVLIAIYKSRRLLLKKRLALLISMAVADLLKVVPSSAQIVAVVYGPSHVNGRSACLVSSSVGFLFIIVTALHLAFESVNRLVSILWPLRYEQFTNSKKYSAIIMSVWLLPVIGVIIPIHFLFGHHRDSYHALRMRMFSCSIDVIQEHESDVWITYVTYAICITVIFLIIPFVIMGASYSIMFKISLKHIREIKRIERQMQKLRQYRESISEEVATFASPGSIISSRSGIHLGNDEDVTLKDCRNQGKVSRLSSCTSPEGRNPAKGIRSLAASWPSSEELVSNVLRDGKSTEACGFHLHCDCTLETDDRIKKRNICTCFPEQSFAGKKACMCYISDGGRENCMEKTTEEASTDDTGRKFILVKNCDNHTESCQDLSFNGVCSEMKTRSFDEAQTKSSEKISVQPMIVVTAADGGLESDPFNFIKEFSVMAAWAETLRQRALEDDEIRFPLSNINQLIRDELRERKREIRLARTLSGLVGAFVVFYLPMVIFAWTNMAKDANQTEFSFDFGRSLVAWAFLNSALNPLIYCLRIVEIKKSVMKILRNLRNFFKCF